MGRILAIAAIAAALFAGTVLYALDLPTRPLGYAGIEFALMTPSAARGILEAIHWKPAITWVIDAIHVLKPIRFQSIRRNEVASKAPAGSRKESGKGWR